MTDPNPRSWRSPSSHYIVNFEKVALIFLAQVQIDVSLLTMAAQPEIVEVCIALDKADKAFKLHTLRSEFEQLMNAYEQWLSGR